MESRVRRRFERDPSLIIAEIEAADKTFIFIDEVQKVTEVLDNIQILMDGKEKNKLKPLYKILIYDIYKIRLNA